MLKQRLTRIKNWEAYAAVPINITIIHITFAFSFDLLCKASTVVCILSGASQRELTNNEMTINNQTTISTHKVQRVHKVMRQFLHRTKII